MKESIARTKQQHTLKNCKACQKQHQDWQLKFPAGPYFNRPSILAANKEVLDNVGKKQATRQALAEINASFSEAYESSFTESLVVSQLWQHWNSKKANQSRE